MTEKCDLKLVETAAALKAMLNLAEGMRYSKNCSRPSKLVLKDPDEVKRIEWYALEELEKLGLNAAGLRKYIEDILTLKLLQNRHE